MGNNQSLNWLLENSGPILQYRAATELLGESDSGKIEQLTRNLLADRLVQMSLDYLRPNFERSVMHGSKPEAFENAMGKLYEFGLRKGIKALDERTELFRRWLEQQIRRSDEGVFQMFYCTLIAAFLSMTGYSEDEAVNATTLRRLETIYPFAKRGDLSQVYVPQDSFPGFPKVFRKRPLVNPELYHNGESMLPSIYDLNAFLHSTPVMEDTQLTAKVEVVVDFIIKPEYQKLDLGYGVIYKPPRKYYAMGWSVHLPGYFESKLQEREAGSFAERRALTVEKDFGRFLLLLNMMSRSKTAREHPWFRRSLSQLEHFRTEDGLIAFPRSFLPERKVGYWIWGLRMALEADRRAPKAITCESTFRYLEIAMRNI